MKSIIIVLTLCISVFTGTSCKTKKATASTTSASSNTTASTTSTNTTTEESKSSTGDNQGAHIGKVSHKYRATGCETVIIFTSEDGTETTLIPKEKLSKDVDVDGQIIKFDYHLLKMAQPTGCTVGMPAEITNITKQK